jgi:hypothetical protein
MYTNDLNRPSIGSNYTIHGWKISTELAASLPEEAQKLYLLNPTPSWPHPSSYYFGYYEDSGSRNELERAIRFMACVYNFDSSIPEIFQGVIL